jgi:hypothetical protein
MKHPMVYLLIQVYFNYMSSPTQIVKNKSQVPIFAIITLAIIFVVGLFVVGYDQGHIFSVVLGESAYEDLYIHELTHDMRHAAGFPCH